MAFPAADPAKPDTEVEDQAAPPSNDKSPADEKQEEGESGDKPGDEAGHKGEDKVEDKARDKTGDKSRLSNLTTRSDSGMMFRDRNTAEAAPKTDAEGEGSEPRMGIFLTALGETQPNTQSYTR